jgi:pimeloyl-ACP methyl ester carboxylesterase
MTRQAEPCTFKISLGRDFMKIAFLFLSVLISSSIAFAEIRFLGQKAEALREDSQILNEGLAGTQAFTFEQKLNHNDPNDQRTFSQRYFINSDYAGILETSPVLYVICGEGTCRTSGIIANHAKELKAHVIYVEHRYYGKSLPTYNLTTDNLKYLSTDFALEDLKAIQKYLQNEKHFTGKWISMGGSYAGSLSAYYRLKNPDLVVGALASSGPVKAKENFEEYDLHVSKVMGPKCGAKIKEVVKKVEGLLNNPEELLKIKKDFQAEALVDNSDFLYLLADMAAFAAQYGFRDRFCSLVDSPNPLDGYEAFTTEIFHTYGMDALSMSAAGAVDSLITDKTNSGMRQWFYQSCTEYGYWQNAYHEKKISMRSSLINAQYHKNICKRLFGLNISGNEKVMNEKYYYPLLNPQSASNILFTNGSQDPWMNLSIAIENKNDLNKNTSFLTMKGASHCNDLQISNLTDVVAGKELFIKSSQDWLKN